MNITTYRAKKHRVKTAKGRSNSSNHWLQRHINDPYVQMAKKEGYVSRAAFKLLDIDAKYQVIGKAHTILDLGAAPGSWLQVLSSKNPTAAIVGVDLVEIDLNLPNTHTVVGNFLDPDIQQKILLPFDELRPELIVSDMAVSSSGERNLDHIRNSELNFAVLDFAEKFLQKNCHLLTKLIRGGEEKNLLHIARKQFAHVKLFKPETSYSDSSEIFMICLNKL